MITRTDSFILFLARMYHKINHSKFIIVSIKYYQIQARSQDFSWGGGGVRLGSEDTNL